MIVGRQIGTQTHQVFRCHKMELMVHISDVDLLLELEIGVEGDYTLERENTVEKWWQVEYSVVEPR